MRAALLVNLGSPASPSRADVRRFLSEFLMDEHVIDLPVIRRTLLVKGIIAPTRARSSSRAYRRVWWTSGSPLAVLSQRLRDAVAASTTIDVALAMRYGQPSIEAVMGRLARQGVDDLLAIPLYPQWAASTRLSVMREVERVASLWGMRVSEHPPFYDAPEYLDVLSNHLAKQSSGCDCDRVLFTFHGLPERHIRLADASGGHDRWPGGPDPKPCCQPGDAGYATCYRSQCFTTARALAARMGLNEGEWQLSFQSRLGHSAWLQPYTASTLACLPAQGVRRVTMVSPAFVADCLETLEEIGMGGRDIFLNAGGSEYRLLSCLNDDPAWVKVVVDWISAWESSFCRPMRKQEGSV